MKTLKKIWNAITEPIRAIYVLYYESREMNEDGSWDKYWAKKNNKIHDWR